MGIGKMFNGSNADLSGINQNVFISALIHKTKIQVTGEGRPASAATPSIFANKATPPKFHANKPFLYFVVDKATMLILFSGQYAVPSVY